MPCGRHLSAREKQQIYFNYIIDRRPVREIFLSIFSADVNLISFRRLREICSYLDKASDLQIDVFLNTSNVRKMFAGRKRILNAAQTVTILDIVSANRNQTIKEVRDEYLQQWFDDIDEHTLSESTVWRTFKREHLSHRIMEARNMLQSPEEQNNFLANIRHVDPSRIVDIDGMSQNRNDFKARHGWAPINDEDCVRMQITIHSRSFAVHAAYTQFGFLAWEIFEGAVNQYHVTHFMEHHLAPFLREDSFCIIDNATNQRTGMVRAALRLFFNDLYLYSPAYTPEFKPIERGFSLVKTFIRKHDCPACAANPVALIQRAFEAYSIEGEFSSSAYGHFNLYRRVHESWLDEVAMEVEEAML
jgi:hypothetical protein